jgi:hypothetical protein
LVVYLGGKGAIERLDGGAVGIHLYGIPPPQLPRDPPDRRYGGLGIRHRPAPPTTTTTKSLTLKQNYEGSADELLRSKKRRSTAWITPAAAAAAEVACPRRRGFAGRATRVETMKKEKRNETQIGWRPGPIGYGLELGLGRV